MTTRNIPGNIPEPDELYGREELIAYVWTQLSGSNILLLAPRRFGKSGIMLHMLRRPRGGYLPLDFELEDVNTPEEFVWRLTEGILAKDLLRNALAQAKGLPGALRKFMQNTLGEAEFGAEGLKARLKFKEAVGKDWRETAACMMLELEKAEPALLFLLDEFPAMIENFTRTGGERTARDFLAWFRTVRLEHKDKLRRHRFVVAGSIGIDTILRKLEAGDKLGDFQRVYVEPLARPAASRLANDLAATFNIAWSPELEQALFGLLGATVPYFIHLFFSEVGQLPAEARSQLTAADLERVYRQRLIGPACKQYFAHFSARLRRHGKSGEKAAMAVLRAVAGAPNGRLSRSELYAVYRKARGRSASDLEFDELLGDLEHDWYLVLDPTTNEYHFMLKVIQDWWQRWYPSRGAR